MPDPKRGMTDLNQPIENKESQRTNHLLIIGIDKYINPSFKDLQNARKDAEDFKALMLGQYQFTEQNTTCLFDEEASRGNILEQFENHLNKLGAEDNLLFYYSGHGEIVKAGRRERGYWIPSDAIYDETHSFISNTSIKQLFEDSYAHHIFGIVDSCFSGSLFVSNRSSVEKRLNSLTSRWLLTAGLLEPVSDGSFGDNSPFAKTLLAHLRGNPDNALWSSDLCLRVLKSVGDNTRNQTPRGEPLLGVGHMGGQFIFRKKGFFGEVEVDEINSKNEEKNKGLNDSVSNRIEVENPQRFSEWKSEIEKDLIGGNLGNTLKTIQNNFNKKSPNYNGFLMQLSRFNRLKNSINLGVVTRQDSVVEMNKIQHSISIIIEDLEEIDFISEIQS